MIRYGDGGCCILIRREVFVVPAYLGSLIACLSAVGIIEEKWTGSLIIDALFCLLIIGHATSLLTVLYPRLKTLHGFLLVIGWASFPAVFWWSCQSLAHPPAMVAPSTVSLSLLLAYGMTVSSFCAGLTVFGRRVSLSAPLLMGFSLFGLTAGTAIPYYLLMPFIVFIVAALFTIGYEHYVPFLQTRRAAVCYVMVSGSVIALILFTAATITAIMPRLHLITPLSADPSNRLAAGLDSYSRFLPMFELTGGTYSSSDQVVMKIHSPRPLLWRGRVYNYYNGYGWNEVEYNDHQRIKPKLRDDIVLPMHVGGGSKPVIEQVQVIVPASNFFSSGVPSRLRFSGQGHDLIVAPQMGIITTDRIEPGTVYTIESWVNDVPPSLLRSSQTKQPTSDDAWNLDIVCVPLEVRALAIEITRHATTPYAKAEAIARYLAEHCTYSLHVPVVPPDQDAVAFFLFQSRQGACDLFASAFAILCRCVGIPSRIVTGYIGSNEHEENGWLIVRERQAHAWAEIEIPPYGWITFDPTPPANDASQSLTATVKKRIPYQFSRYGALTVLGCFLLLPALFILRRAETPHPHKATSVQQQIWRSYEHLCRRFHPHVRRSPHQTPAEHLAQAKEKCPFIPASTWDDLTRITEQLAQVLYSPRPIAVEDAAALCAQMQRVAHQLRRQKKPRQVKDFPT